MSDYVVTCLDDDGERVKATRQSFTLEEAERYASTVCPSRKPEPRMVCTFCGLEWRTGYVEGTGPENDWPRCLNCHAC